MTNELRASAMAVKEVVVDHLDGTVCISVELSGDVAAEHAVRILRDQLREHGRLTIDFGAPIAVSRTGVAMSV